MTGHVRVLKLSNKCDSNMNKMLIVLVKYRQVAPPKEKQKVEDGIFGTSGGIGFTKQNELFVGRVAMIGFAVSITTLQYIFSWYQIHYEIQINSETNWITFQGQ